jgi:hypothetical protein
VLRSLKAVCKAVAVGPLFRRGSSATVTGTPPRTTSWPSPNSAATWDRKYSPPAGKPSPSSILVPSSCRLSGASVTAAGTYQGSFVPAVYPELGHVLALRADSESLTCSFAVRPGRSCALSPALGVWGCPVCAGDRTGPGPAARSVRPRGLPQVHKATGASDDNAAVPG